MNSTQFLDWLDKKSQFFDIHNPEKPLIMGILNVTPDSFSDGGAYHAVDKACDHALELVKQGADMIDVGGESSKPGACEVPLDIELERVIPVIKQIRKCSDVCISIDTYKPEVMSAAVHAGANLINDINALRTEGALQVAATLDVPVCLMHMQGMPRTMQVDPNYPTGVLFDVLRFFADRIKACDNVGIRKEKIILDPGFGFGKSVKNNLQLVHQLEKFHVFQLPLLLGVSRKSTIGALLSKEVGERLIGGITLAVYAALKGISIIRTHDVEETKQAFTILDALSNVDKLSFDYL